MPDKLCECGCGQPAPIARQTRAQFGHIQGQPIRFCSGHNASGPPVIHGHGRTSRQTPTYSSWRNMINRCTNPRIACFRSYYCGVGICERWRAFPNFLADMGERPPGMTLGRFLDIGSYTKENVKWMTSQEPQQ